MSFRDFEVETTAIGGLLVVRPKTITDDRGVVRELYRASAFDGFGALPFGPWLQVNLTETVRGALRGMHGEDMTKLVAVVAGRAHGAYVDTRPGSPSHGVVVEVDLAVGTQVLVPAGVANGFQAVEDGTQYLYCFDAEWVPGMAGTAIAPLDPALGIAWPLPVDPDDPAQLSVKDRDAPGWVRDVSG